MPWPRPYPSFAPPPSPTPSPARKPFLVACYVDLPVGFSEADAEAWLLALFGAALPDPVLGALQEAAPRGLVALDAGTDASADTEREPT